MQWCLSEGKRGSCLGPPFLGSPSWYFARKYSFLVKKLLSAYIIFSEPHHSSVLCLQRGPEEYCFRLSAESYGTTNQSTRQ